jgi:hypothetical protein
MLIRFLKFSVIALSVFFWGIFALSTAYAVDVTPQQAKILATKSALFETKTPALPPAYYQQLLETFPKLSKAEQTQLLALETDCQTLHQQFTLELGEDQPQDLAHLSQLWQAAVERSQSIRYAIDKLSAKDASGKTVKNDIATKRLLNSIAQIGGATGSLLTGSPIGLISGSVLTDAISTTTSNQKPVTDADMVILAKAVESLQSELLEAYYEFSFQRANVKLAEQLYQRFRLTFQQQRKALQTLNDTSNTPYFLPLLESFLLQQQQEIQQTKQVYIRTKQQLTLIAGEPAVTTLEQTLNTSQQ